MEGEGGDLMNILLPGQGSEDDHRRVVDGTTHIAPTDYGQGNLEFSARMQSLGQNAGLQQAIPPIMSPSHGSSNYGAFQTQQSFPQNTGTSMLQGDLYQMPGQQSSSYFGGASYSGYGSGYPNQGSKQRGIGSSSGYQSNYQQADSFGSASTLQNFGQFEAPPLSPVQHRPPVPSPSAVHPGMIHAGNSFSFGSVPRASTASTISQQRQMQGSNFQGSLQHPESSPSYSQLQMSSQVNMSVGSSSYSAYGGPSRTQSSPGPHQSLTLSNVPGSFTGMSPPSPKQMHLPGRTVVSPVLQQMQPMGSQSNHPLRSPGSGSLSRQSTTSPLGCPNSSPPPITGLVRRSPTPVQQMYPSNVGSNTAAQQLSPQHSPFSLQSLPQQLPCMYGWGNEAHATGPLPSPTQLRYLQQQLIDDEVPVATSQTRAPNTRSVIQPTGVTKMPAPVPRKTGGGATLSRKHSAGVAATNMPGPVPKLPKLDNHSPPRLSNKPFNNNIIANKGELAKTRSLEDPTDRSISENSGKIMTSTSNGKSPGGVGVAQLKRSVSTEENRDQIIRHAGNVKSSSRKSQSSTALKQEDAKETRVQEQNKEICADMSILKADVCGAALDSVQCRKVKHNGTEEKDSKNKSEVGLLKTMEKGNSQENATRQKENKLKDAPNLKSTENLESDDYMEIHYKTVEKKNVLKHGDLLTYEFDQKPDAAAGRPDEVSGQDDDSSKEESKQKQVEPEEEKNEEATQKPNPDKPVEPLEKVIHRPSSKEVDMSKEKSPEPDTKESLHQIENQSTPSVNEKIKTVSSESTVKLGKFSTNDENLHSPGLKTDDSSSSVNSKERKEESNDKEELLDGLPVRETEEKSKQSAAKSTINTDIEMTLQNKSSKSAGVHSVIVTSVAGGTSALSGTTAITASVIAKGQAQGTGQQVLVAKTPSGQMYLIQGNVLIPVQNVQVQQEKGKHGSKVIVVNPAQSAGGKHSSIKTTSTVTKLSSNIDSQRSNKSSGRSKPIILSHSLDKKPQIANLQTHEQEAGPARRDNNADKHATISISSKERLKEKIVGNLDAKIKVIEQTEKHVESKVLTSPTSKGSPTLSAKGKKIGRPLGSKDKQKRKPYASRKGSYSSTVETLHVEPSAVVRSSAVVESSAFVETSSKRGQRGRPRKPECEKLTPQKSVKRTLAIDVPTVGYPTEGTKKTKYSTRIPSIKFISVVPKGCAVGDPWCCCLCGKPPHYGYLGVLFGPYKAKLLSRERKDSTSKGSKSPNTKLLSPASKSKQISAENSDTTVATESEAAVLELWAHKDCAIWSHGVYMQGRNLEGLEQATESAAQHKCTKCCQIGATLACFKRGCNQIYHFACAKESGCSFEEDNYTIFCASHSNK